MNEYFCFIGEKLTAEYCSNFESLLSEEIRITGDGRIFDFREINEGDIHEAICRIKVKKSFGNDNISGYFLKIAFSYISRILMLIFNTFIETSTFPVSWKVTRVTPFTKKVKSQKGHIIDQYRCYLFYLGFSRNLSMTSCTNTKNGVGC